MSEHAIADVGDTLVTLLRNGITNLDPDQIALMSPADAQGNSRIRLTLFLYSVVEFPAMKNEPALVTSPTAIRRPPLHLELYYLLTSYPGTGSAHENTLEAHRILGRAMQIYYDNGILAGSILQGNLPPDHELRLTLNPITVEDLTRIWSVFPNSGYHPSVSYLVSPATIDSRRFVGAPRVVDKRVAADHLVPTGGGS